jgi:hypothetical protein
MAAVGAVLLLILKILGIVLAVLVGVFILLLVLPASVWISYQNDALTVKAGMFFIRFKLWPRPEKPKREKTKVEQAEKEKKPKESKEKIELTVDQICDAVKDTGAFAKKVLGTMRITQIRLYLPISGADAADTALNYGRAQGWLHASLGFLNRLLWLDFKECRLEPDFTGKSAEPAYASCKISAQLIIIGIAGFKLYGKLKDNGILDALL